MIIDEKKKGDSMLGSFRCVALDNCDVEDISRLSEDGVRFYEFLIWRPYGMNERERWSVANAGIYKYYEFDPSEL